jgi:cytochrome c oxidase subunit II
VPGRPPASSRARAGCLLACALAAAGFAVSCSSGFGTPDPASEEGEEVAELWRVLLLTAGVLAAVVFGLLTWAIVRFRRRGRDDLPPQTHGSALLEAVYVAVPTVVVAVLFVYILHVEEVGVREGPADVVVEVTSFRWGWLFEYDDGAVTVSSSPGQPGELPELVVPVDAVVRFDLHTSDVIHSFAVPALLTKQDALPGEEKQLLVRTTRTGRFDGHCAEYCGLEHARMDFTLVVVTAEEFATWLDDRRDAPT